jgi:hypothetical protein
LEIGDLEVAVVLSCTYDNDLRIAFPAGSPEAETLKRKLSDQEMGQKLGIMKTDDYHNPILIRKLSSQR